MVTSKTPWCISEMTPKGCCTIKDANGNIVGYFLNREDAEVVVALTKGKYPQADNEFEQKKNQLNK